MPPTPRERSRAPRPLAIPVFVPLLALLITAGMLAAGPEPIQNASGPGEDAAEEIAPDITEAIITKTDGKQVEGLLIREDADAIVLQTRRGEVIIPTSLVRDVEILDPLIERYRRLRADIPEGDVIGRINLAEWLRDRRAYRLALSEVDKALSIEPFNREAKRLRRWLELQIELARPAEGTASERGRERRDRREKKREFPLLGEGEVNLLKVFEVDLSDPPRMVIDRETVDRFLEAYADHPLIPPTEAGRDAIRRWAAPRVLDLMFRVKARDFYHDVRVLDDPEAMKRFREEVHDRWLINSCATTACHGGEAAGRLYLNNDTMRRGKREEIVYTNFLILERFKLADGTPLIDYEHPRSSPLLQMGLPREKSEHPHPEVGARRGTAGWRHVFRDDRDLRFREALEWINAMYRPRPDYPIEYEPPKPDGPLSETPAEPVER